MRITKPILRIEQKLQTLRRSVNSATSDNLSLVDHGTQRACPKCPLHCTKSDQLTKMSSLSGVSGAPSTQAPNWGDTVQTAYPHQKTIPLGVVLRRTPGVTRWAAWNWRAVSVLPGAAEKNWYELRREGDAIEYHAATMPLDLYRSDAEAYLQGLSAKVPAIYVIMRVPETGDAPLEVLLVTASPYEAQDYADNGEDIVERVPMPEGLVAYVRDFVNEHHEEEVFVKRRRNKHRTDLTEDGIGDERIRQVSDVYRAPRNAAKGQIH